MIKKVSPERSRDEFTKILLSNLAGRGLILLQQLGLWSLILPVHLDRKAFENILNIVDNLPSNLTLRLSALLYPGYSSSTSRRERSAEILKKLRFKNSIIKKVTILVQDDWQAINFSKKVNIRQLTSRIGMENLEDAWELKKALIKGCHSSERFKSAEIERAENNIRETLQERPPVSLKDLAVKGKDLIELGYNEGEEIGQILKELLNLVLEKPALNQKKILLTWVKEKNFH